MKSVTAPSPWDIVRTFSRLPDADRAALLRQVPPPPLSPAIRAGLAGVVATSRKAA